MGVYVYSEQRIDALVVRSRRLRIRFRLIGVLVGVVSFLLVLYHPTVPVFRGPIPTLLIAESIAILTPLLFPIVKNFSRWKTWPEATRRSLRETKVDINSGTISVFGPFGYKRQLRADEVVRAEEPHLGTGLYLRTSNRYRWMLIPRTLDGYEAIKRELAATGTPIVRTSIPANWEEFLFVLLFTTTIFCSIMFQDRRILIANLVIAGIVSVAGFLIVNANPDNPQLRRARIGILIPVVFAVLGLVLRNWN